jgi:hypothetical protein
LNNEASLSGWSTPSAQGSAGEISEDLEIHGKKFRNRKTGRILQSNLATEAKMLTSWPTPNGEDAKAGQSDLAHRQQSSLPRTASWSVPATASGPTPSGSPVGTGKCGQLNPALSRWLQGCPAAWDRCSPNYDDWRKWQDFMAAHLNGLKETELED